MTRNPTERERLGRVVLDAARTYSVAVGGDLGDSWEAFPEREREGFRRMGEAVADALAKEPAPARYRILKLNGYQDLEACRVEEFEWAGTRMLRVTTLCKEPVQVLEILPTRIYESRVLTEAEALAAVEHATARRAAQARAEEERTRREAREQALRREARATTAATVTVVGPHVEIRPTDPDKVPRADLLRRDDAEVIEALRAAEIEPYSARDLYTDTRDAALVGLEIVHEAERVDAIVAILHALGFGTVTRLPDQPARVEAQDEEIPFDEAPAPTHGDAAREVVILCHGCGAPAEGTRPVPSTTCCTPSCRACASGMTFEPFVGGARG